jgi:hypothetical protein
MSCVALPRPGRYGHSTLSLASNGGDAFGVYTVILMPLLSSLSLLAFSVKNDSVERQCRPVAGVARGERRRDHVEGDRQTGALPEADGEGALARKRC